MRRWLNKVLKKFVRRINKKWLNKKEIIHLHFSANGFHQFGLMLWAIDCMSMGPGAHFQWVHKLGEGCLKHLHYKQIFTLYFSLFEKHEPVIARPRDISDELSCIKKFTQRASAICSCGRNYVKSKWVLERKQIQDSKLENRKTLVFQPRVLPPYLLRWRGLANWSCANVVSKENICGSLDNK